MACFSENQVDLFLEKIQYTPGDLISHEGIAAVIMKDDKILIMDHVKYNFWTIPVGKVENGQTVEEGLIQELKEELNIVPIKFKNIGIFKKGYMRKGKRVTVTMNIFKINSWRGKLKNNEPSKHRSIKFMTIEEIKKIKNISDSTKEMLKVLI